MIEVAADAEGIRQAALELLEEAFREPERQRTRKLAERAANPEELREAAAPARTLAAGYYVWVEYLTALESEIGFGVVVEERFLAGADLVGLAALAAARMEFNAKHPPCPGCGRRLENEWSKLCPSCSAERARTH